MISHLTLHVRVQRSHCLAEEECSRKSQPHHTPNLKHSLNRNENWVIKNRLRFQNRCSADTLADHFNSADLICVCVLEVMQNQTAGILVEPFCQHEYGGLDRNAHI